VRYGEPVKPVDFTTGNDRKTINREEDRESKAKNKEGRMPKCKLTIWPTNGDSIIKLLLPL